MGDMLIALIIGVYVLVPFMYVFNFAMYDVLLTSDDCTMFQDAVCDFAISGTDCATACTANGFWYVARFIPQAFFLPNLTIAVLITFLGGIHKALRVIG